MSQLFSVPDEPGITITPMPLANDGNINMATRRSGSD
jgi:hypothetical protein